MPRVLILVSLLWLATAAAAAPVENANSEALYTPFVERYVLDELLRQGEASRVSELELA